jgi:GH25 family lysozyme M1 (1,4-beta-N-acetylmuramidase)
MQTSKRNGLLLDVRKKSALVAVVVVDGTPQQIFCCAVWLNWQLKPDGQIPGVFGEQKRTVVVPDSTYGAWPGIGQVD